MNLTPQVLANADAPDFSGLSGEALQTALFSQLRRETRIAVMDCHSMYREMYGLETPLPILGWIVTWARGWGLHEDDAARILTLVCDPEWMEKTKNATELKKLLASMAVEKIKLRAMRMPRQEPRVTDAVVNLAASFGGPN